MPLAEGEQLAGIVSSFDTWNFHEDSSNALTNAVVQSAPGAGFAIFITDIVVSIGAATAFNFSLRAGSSTIYVGPYYLEAVSGRGLAIHFKTPIRMPANTMLSITTSAAIAHGIDITGFTAAV